MHVGLSGDVFYQVAEGRWMLAHHAVVSHDMFSYTVLGRPWLSEEWGFALLLAWMVAHLGAVSYWLVSAGACCGALLLSVVRWRKTGSGWLWTAALSILAAAGMYDFVSPRPQDLSYLFLATLLLVLTLARRRTVWLVAAPPLLLVWANLHGSFLLGLGILVLEFLLSLLPALPGRLTLPKLPSKAMAITVLAGLVATLVNPHGPGLLTYSYHVSSSSELTSFISEWQSPNFHSLFWMAVIAGPLLVLLGLLAFSTTTFFLDDVLLACITFLATLHAARFTPYWWSDYLIYENFPVFVDGRTDVYFGTGILETYVNVSDVSVDPDPVFRHWDVRWVMWNKGTTLAVYLNHDPAWRTVYRSGDAVVFEHVGSWGAR